jgi:DNA-binding IclR family transcriptional regulator
MYQLSQTSGQSCHLVIAGPGYALVIAQQPGTGPTGFGVRLGALLDLQDSASGNVILALSDQQQRDTLLNGQKLSAEIAERLEDIAAAGFEQRESRRSAGVRDISCPIFGFDGRVAGALTVPYLTLIDGTEQLDEDGTRNLLLSAGSQISADLGYSGMRPSPPASLPSDATRARRARSSAPA